MAHQLELIADCEPETETSCQRLTLVLPTNWSLWSV